MAATELMRFLGTVLAVLLFTASFWPLHLLMKNAVHMGARGFIESFADPYTGTTAFFSAWALLFAFSMFALSI